MVIKLTLNVPPSVNHYYGRTKAGRSFLGKKGKEYREHVSFQSLAEKRLKGLDAFPLTGRIHIQIEFFPPDKRKRDIDNILKCLFDSIEHAGIIENDSQIASLIIRKHDPTPKDGKVFVVLTQTLF